MTRGSPYLTVYHRLCSNLHEPQTERDCWRWAGKKGGGWYGRMNLYVPGLAAVATLQVHIVAFVCVHGGAVTADEVFLAALELKHSGLELDHLCFEPSCCNPDHLEPVTPKENSQRRRNWRP